MSRIWIIRAGAGLVMSLTTSLPSVAETQTENIVAESRTYLYFQASAEAAQALLPAGWTVNPLAAGPAKDANLILVLIDRKLALQPDGAPLGAGMGRVAVGVVPGKDASGEARTFIVTGLSADPAGAPGAYQVYSPGEVSLERHETASVSDLSRTVDETWTAKGADGNILTAHVTFTTAVPATTTFESKNYSGADPAFYRIYRGSQAADVVRSQANAVDRASVAEVTVSGGSFEALDGAPIIAITSMPFYSRQTFLP